MELKLVTENIWYDLFKSFPTVCNYINMKFLEEVIHFANLVLWQIFYESF